MDLQSTPMTESAEVTPIVVATPTPRHRSRRTLAAIAGTALVVMTLGASVALASSPAPTTLGAALPGGSAMPVDQATADAAFKAYASCMRDHGVNLPDPVTVSSGAASTSAGTVPGGAATAGGPLVLVPVDGTAGGPVTIVSGPVVAAPDGGTASGTATTGSGVIVMSGTAQAIGTPVDDTAFKTANAACAPILEKAGIQTSGTIVTNGADLSGPVTGSISGSAGGAGVIGIGVAGGGDTTRIAADMTTYAACMRSHGVDMADPVVDSASGGVRMQYDGDPSTATFRAADTACATSTFPGFAAPPAPVATAAP